MPIGALSGGKHWRRRRRWAVCLAAAALLSFASFASFAPVAAFANPTPPAGAEKKAKQDDDDSTKPWIKTRSLCVFRFAAEELPDTSEDFAEALTKGCRRALKVPKGRRDQLVSLRGTEGYPAVESLRINLSDSAVDLKDKRSKSLKPGDEPIDEPLRVGLFEVSCNPLRSGKAKAYMDLRAADVRLDLVRDRSGQHCALVMTDAKDGRLKLEVANEDVEQVVLIAANEEFNKYAVSFQRADVELTAEEGGRSVRVNMKVRATVGIIPAGLRFKARLDIDDDLNATLSGLTCTGAEALGPLISQIIQPALKKANGNGKTRPLVAFPGGKVKLREVEITTGERVRVTAAFGS